MKTRLEQLRDLLAGLDDAAADALRAELSDPTSEVSRFFARAALVARDPLSTERAAETSPATTPEPAPSPAPRDPSVDPALALTRTAPLEGAAGDPAPRPAAPPPLPPPLPPALDPDGPFPQPFGRYEVRGWLGGGGMADVYHAYDPVLDIQVALKVPRPHLLARPAFRAQFLHEARAMARLDHPTICRV